MNRGVPWFVAGVAACAGVAFASSCVIDDSCHDSATCLGDGGGGSADAAAMDACADGGCLTVADAANADGGFDVAAGDATADSCGEGCGVADAPDGFVDSSTADGAADAGDSGDGGPLASDASGAGSFLGAWTLTGKETFDCPDAAGLSDDASANPSSETVTFSAGPGPTDAGEVDLLFDAGEGCSLAMVVDAGVASLVFEPQTCVLAGNTGIDWTFTSVRVSPSMGSLGIVETFTDRLGCTYAIQGGLTRAEGG
jgi:hypothetical protein